MKNYGVLGGGIGHRIVRRWLEGKVKVVESIIETTFQEAIQEGVVKEVTAVCVGRCYHNRIGTICLKVPAMPWMLNDCSH